VRDATDCIDVVDDGDPPSVAAFIDEARAQLVEAWDRGQDPDAVVVSARLLEILSEAKRHESARGVPLTVLGLFVRQRVQPPAPPAVGHSGTQENRHP
jgi:hypothetical protein